MKIKELSVYSQSDVLDLDRLMHELSVTSFCNEEILDRILRDENSHLFVVRNENSDTIPNHSELSEPTAGHIIACACLCIAHSPEFTLGFVESVTVLSPCRGKGYGRMLMEHMIEEAKRLGVQHLHLTSNPKRVAANGLYQALGFKKYDTNCYQLNINE